MKIDLGPSCSLKVQFEPLHCATYSYTGVAIANLALVNRHCTRLPPYFIVNLACYWKTMANNSQFFRVNSIITNHHFRHIFFLPELFSVVGALAYERDVVAQREHKSRKSDTRNNWMIWVKINRQKIHSPNCAHHHNILHSLHQVLTRVGEKRPSAREEKGSG